MPFFSIIIPLYNKEHFIVNTLQSALDQTYSDFEIIIINDGSTDGSLEKINQFTDSRVSIFTIKNQGVSHARNFGISKASANYIAFLDADDLWLPNHLESLKNLILNYPNCGIYCKSYQKKFFENTTLNCKFYNLKKDFSGIIPDYFLNSFIDEIAWTSAVAMPKIILNKYRGFDIALKSGQDTDLWTKVAIHEKVAFSTKTSAVKVINADGNHLSMSNKRVDRLKFLKKYKPFEDKNKNLEKYMDLNRFSVAIERKIKDDAIWKSIVKDIDYNNLNLKQKILLKSPKSVLVSLKQFQIFMLKYNIYLTSFK
ncbi:glycosyltransferase family 2 protein [Bizionia argentinensis JUB59]|uniref:Glycosyltransferase family 2 protein n=1 Tax=Bizionia argentinensis JUB59 TaxID=1046627 RepID=G2EG72_9FLAO|nr:glycosyltransferase family 2 protein [Bizionia argentinensis]EGV42621.1 glycosyltransferase family 2 protein [Bizionia argentinensis JUB59]